MKLVFTIPNNFGLALGETPSVIFGASPVSIAIFVRAQKYKLLRAVARGIAPNGRIAARSARSKAPQRAPQIIRRNHTPMLCREFRSPIALKILAKLPAPNAPCASAWCGCGCVPWQSRPLAADGPAYATLVRAHQDFGVRRRNRMPCDGLFFRCSYLVKVRAGRGSSSVFRLHCGFSFRFNGAAPGKLSVSIRLRVDSGRANGHIATRLIIMAPKAIFFPAKHESLAIYRAISWPGIHVGSLDGMCRPAAMRIAVRLAKLDADFRVFKENFFSLHNFVSVIFCLPVSPGRCNRSRLQRHNTP
jgi:hypothetical protein